MSRIVVSTGAPAAHFLQRCGMLPALANRWAPRRASYHACSSKPKRDSMLIRGCPPVRHASSDIVIKSQFPEVEVPKENLVEYIWKDTEKWDDVPVATCASSGRNYSFGMMKMLIDRFAQALLSHCGMKPGEIVAILSPNIPEYILISHGIIAAGLTATFANPLYTADELKRQFQNAGVKAIVTIPLFLDVSLSVAKHLQGYRTTICAGGEDDAVNNVQGLQSMLMAGHTADLPTIDPRDMALLPYSSGTTGLPKGVKLSHCNLSVNLEQINSKDLIPLQPEEMNQKALTVLPMFHIYGFNAIMNTSIKLGVPLVTLPRFTPEDYIKALIEHRPYFLFVVPSLLLFLASHPSVKKEHLASVQSITSGAAPATEGLITKFQEKIGRDVLFRQGYGMTETAPVLLLTPRVTPSSKKDTSGVLLPSTQAKVINLSTGETLGPNKSGELLVKGPQVMQGYFKNEKATAETLTKDGWLHTGDVVYYDDDRYFYIIDRCKELIKVKGNQVSPTELENIILEIPGVADVAVVGIPDTLAGELPRAFIVKKSNANVTEEIVTKHVHAKVAPYKKLAGGVKFIDTIPRNPGGKVLRNQLKIIES